MSKKGSEAMTTASMDSIERGGTVLVFGMEWFPLIGGQPERQARALARQQRASHRVVCGGGAVSVGLLRSRRRRKEHRRLCSAAAAFASLHPTGTVAAQWVLPDGRRWLVGVHEGAVMARTDNLHDASVPIHDTLRLLQEAHPGLVLHDASRAPSEFLDALFDAARQHGELMPEGRLTGASTALLAVLIAGAGLAALAGHGLLPGRAGNRPPAVQDAHAIWRDAIESAARGHLVHGVAGLQAALDAMQEVPVVVAGWQLARVECRPRSRQWHCRARYRRGPAADNDGFIAGAAPHWTLAFDPLEGAQASWSREMPAMSLARVNVRRRRENEARLVSALQAVVPAFSELRLEAPQALPLRVPLDAQQRPIPRPPGVVGHQRRGVRVQAPLRSLAMLLPEVAHMSWDRIVLEVGDADLPSLRSSGLRVSMSGVLYETEDGDDAIDGSSGAEPLQRIGHDVAGGAAGPGHGA